MQNAVIIYFIAFKYMLIRIHPADVLLTLRTRKEESLKKYFRLFNYLPEDGTYILLSALVLTRANINPFIWSIAIWSCAVALGNVFLLVFNCKDKKSTRHNSAPLASIISWIIMSAVCHLTVGWYFMGFCMYIVTDGIFLIIKSAKPKHFVTSVDTEKDNKPRKKKSIKKFLKMLSDWPAVLLVYLLLTFIVLIFNKGGVDEAFSLGGLAGCLTQMVRLSKKLNMNQYIFVCLGIISTYIFIFLFFELYEYWYIGLGAYIGVELLNFLIKTFAKDSITNENK